MERYGVTAYAVPFVYWVCVLRKKYVKGAYVFLFYNAASFCLDKSC